MLGCLSCQKLLGHLCSLHIVQVRPLQVLLVSLIEEPDSNRKSKKKVPYSCDKVWIDEAKKKRHNLYIVLQSGMAKNDHVQEML